MSIFQSLIWTCDSCGETKIVYREVDANQELDLVVPSGTKWAQIQFDVNEPSKLLCQNCVNNLTRDMDIELIDETCPWTI